VWRDTEMRHNCGVTFLSELGNVIVQQFMADLPDMNSFVRVTLRLMFALMLAACIGWERERGGKSAGLRTHILVALGSALFVISLGEAGAEADELTRVAQGIAAGIGFIGGGVILKLPSERRVEGLTTAASVWLTAAVGVAAGTGKLGAGLIGLLLCLLVLVVLQRFAPRSRKQEHEQREADRRATDRRRDAHEANNKYSIDDDAND
jgi:putative Mg2+ transporter-C (MgtC) family protein